jgi:hypothetical protein
MGRKISSYRKSRYYMRDEDGYIWQIPEIKA